MQKWHQTNRWRVAAVVAVGSVVLALAAALVAMSVRTKAPPVAADAVFADWARCDHYFWQSVNGNLSDTVNAAYGMGDTVGFHQDAPPALRDAVSAEADLIVALPSHAAVDAVATYGYSTLNNPLVTAFAGAVAQDDMNAHLNRIRDARTRVLAAATASGIDIEPAYQQALSVRRSE